MTAKGGQLGCGALIIAFVISSLLWWGIVTLIIRSRGERLLAVSA